MPETVPPRSPAPVRRGPSHFLGCDWGTSSFRVRLVARADHAILATFENSEGARTVHSRLVERGVHEDPAARSREFQRVLAEAVTRVLADQPDTARHAPIVISGMASSTVGWQVVPYGHTPCALDGRGLRTEELNSLTVPDAGSTHRIWLVSGLRCNSDIMRGEESEILGILTLPEFARFGNDGLLVLPGTHCKHVHLRAGRITTFRTFLTGELLELLSTRSLLSASVNWPPPPLEDDDASRKEFLEGVQLARSVGLARGLFQVRARAVLDSVPARSNSGFLGGLLIGSELLDLATWDGTPPILLAASRHFATPYRLAAEALGLGPRLTVTSPTQLLLATVRAQGLLLDHLLERSRFS